MANVGAAAPRPATREARTQDMARTKRGGQGNTRTKILLTIVGAAIAIGWALPLLWVLSGAFKPHHEIISQATLLPKEATLLNWVMLTDPSGKAVNIFIAFFNSIVVSTGATLGALVVCSLAAYAFARIPFRGRKPLLVALVGTMVIPNEVLLVPLFEQFNQLGLLNTYAAMMTPHVVSVFGIFLLYQFVMNTPVELSEAAFLDGANHFQIYRYIVLPAIKPALSTLGIFVFLEAWNDFLWPLIVVQTPEMQTLPLALITFRGAYTNTDYGVVLASVILAILPPLLFFLVAQKAIVQGISRTGLKG